MEESLNQKAYYLVLALYKETFQKAYENGNLNLSKLPITEPDYPTIYYTLLQLRDEEARKENPNRALLTRITGILDYGSDWRLARARLIKEGGSKYNDHLKRVLRFLNEGLQPGEQEEMQGLEFRNKLLASGMKFYKVHLPNLKNEVTAKINNKVTLDPTFPKSFNNTIPRNGDPRVYLHNPARSNVIFVKERFLPERFPEYLRPFMKRTKLSLYLCSIDTMLAYLAYKHGKNGVLNLIAMSNKNYINSLDDRTLFMVLEKRGEVYVPIEMCYGDMKSMVPLVQMQTFAFCAGITPNEMAIYNINHEFQQFNEEKYSHKILNPNHIVLLGWWNENFKRIIKLYMEQAMRIVLSELVFEVITFMKEKNQPITSNLFKEAGEQGFTPSPYFRTGLRYQFYNYLMTSYQEEFTEDSMDHMLNILFQVLKRTKFSDVYYEDQRIRKDHITDLLQHHSNIKGAENFLKRELKDFKTTGKQIQGPEQKEFQQKLTALKLQHQQKIETIKKQNRIRLMQEHNLHEPSSQIFFNQEEFRVIKNHFFGKPSIDARVQKQSKLLNSILDPVFNHPIQISIGRKSFAVIPPKSRVPVEAQAEQLINQGFKSFIFYGTAGGVKNVPAESFAIPEVIYFYPESYYNIDPEKYAPLPIENILLDDTAKGYFNTDNFHRADHIFVSATYQEHESFLQRIFTVFKQRKEVSIDMDLAPLAKVCMDKNVGLGGIMYITDVLKGAEQRQERKGFYLRQMLLSFLRAYESKEFKINGRSVEETFNDQFQELMRSTINEIVKIKVEELAA